MNSVQSISSCLVRFGALEWQIFECIEANMRKMFKVTLGLKSNSTFDLLTRPSQNTVSEKNSHKIESICVLLLESKSVFVAIVVVKWNQVQTLTLFENQFYALGINDFEFHKKIRQQREKTICVQKQSSSSRTTTTASTTTTTTKRNLHIKRCYWGVFIALCIYYPQYNHILNGCCYLSTKNSFTTKRRRKKKHRFLYAVLSITEILKTKPEHTHTQYKVDIGPFEANNWRWFSCCQQIHCMRGKIRALKSGEFPPQQ